MRAINEVKSVSDNVGSVKQSPGLKIGVRRGLICYYCGQEGHKQSRCPSNASTQANVCTVPRHSCAVAPVVLPCVDVVLNGQKVRALVDTGSMQSLVHSYLVLVDLWSHTSRAQICCVHGEERQYPTTSVQVKVQGQAYLLEVGVVDGLQYPMILGRDLPVLVDLLTDKNNMVGEYSVALTRAKAQKQNADSQDLSMLPYFEVDLEAQPGKPRKSKRQKRLEKLRFAGTHCDELLVEQCMAPVKNPQGIGVLQQEDSLIAPLYT